MDGWLVGWYFLDQSCEISSWLNLITTHREMGQTEHSQVVVKRWRRWEITFRILPPINSWIGGLFRGIVSHFCSSLSLRSDWWVNMFSGMSDTIRLNISSDCGGRSTPSLSSDVMWLFLWPINWYKLIGSMIQRDMGRQFTEKPKKKL